MKTPRKTSTPSFGPGLGVAHVAIQALNIQNNACWGCHARDGYQNSDLISIMSSKGKDAGPVGRGRGVHAPPRNQKGPPDEIIKDLK